MLVLLLDEQEGEPGSEASDNVVDLEDDMRDWRPEVGAFRPDRAAERQRAIARMRG